MAGMMMDPNKCAVAAFRLLPQSAYTYITVHGYTDGFISPTPGKWRNLGVLSFIHVAGWKFIPASRWIYNIPEALTNLINDCDIDDGLKRKLEQFKTKASEVAGKLLPTPAPVLEPTAASYVALDLAGELGRSTVVSTDPTTTGGNGMVDKVFKGVVVGGVLVYGGIALAPVLTAAVPSGAPILAGAAAL